MSIDSCTETHIVSRGIRNSVKHLGATYLKTVQAWVDEWSIEWRSGGKDRNEIQFAELVWALEKMNKNLETVTTYRGDGEYRTGFKM